VLLEIVDVDERPIALDELDGADEVFVTSSTREVQPVHAVDGRALDAPGPATRPALDAWRALVTRTLDP
jgi:branched-chain amino acid aminotransferase